MTRQVYDNGMVAHLWANQSQESARSHNGNFWFEGDTIYSYRTKIGQIVRTNSGETVYLVTSERFSITTTTKHMSAIHRAIPSREYHVFNVPHLGVTGPDSQWHRENRDHLKSLYDAEVTRLKRKRDRPEDWYFGILQDQYERARLYARLFDLEMPEMTAPDVCWQVIQETHDKRETRRWLAGEKVSVPRTTALDSYGGALLRVNYKTLEPVEIETTLGARVPVKDAVKVFRFVKLIRGRGETRQRNGQEIPVGQFQLDTVWPNGDIKAGCHRISWPEIERIAKELGVFDLTASDDAVLENA